jgi:hypothetical protein
VRSIAIWGQNRRVIALIVLIIIGHWALILQSACAALRPRFHPLMIVFLVPLRSD